MVFVSGYNRFQAPGWLRPVVPYAFYGLIKGPDLLPAGLVKWAFDGADVTGGDIAGKGREAEVREEDRKVEGACTMECEFGAVLYQVISLRQNAYGTLPEILSDYGL